MARSDRILNLSILVVGRSPALRNLRHSLLWQKRKLEILGNMQVDLCEVVSDVLREGEGVDHDFIVLTIDMEVYGCLNEVDLAVGSLQKQILMHRVCILSIADVPPCRLSIQYDDIHKFREKYGMPFIFSDIKCKTKCHYAAERLLILASAAMGLRSGLPTIV